MPCYGPPLTNHEIEKQQIRKELEREKTLLRAEAILCGIFRMFELAAKKEYVDELLDHVDWAQVGCSKRSAIRWWRRHKDADVAEGIK